MFGENTDKGREKFVDELEETHQLFKDFVQRYRPQVDISQVATGEIWFGQQAQANHLVDGLSTSDQYLIDAAGDADIYTVRYEQKKSLQDKLSDMTASASDKVLTRWWGRLTQPHTWSR